MLEQVGEPGTARLFVLGTHMIPDIHRYHGNGVILVEDNVEPVGKFVFFELQFGKIVGKYRRSQQNYQE
jgi:hypothetical protein